MLHDEIKSDVERYLVSLPNPRTTAEEVRTYSPGEVDEYEESLRQLVKTAFQDNHSSDDPYRNELLTVYIKDKRNKIPNEYELATWLQKRLDDENRDDWFKISHCKIFELNSRKNDKKTDHKYKVIVHFCTPNDYWIEIDV